MGTTTDGGSAHWEHSHELDGRSPLAWQGVRMGDVLKATQRATLTGFRLLDPWGTVIAGSAEVGLVLWRPPSRTIYRTYPYPYPYGSLYSNE